MEDGSSSSEKSKPPQGRSKPPSPLKEKQPFFISKRKSKSFESQIQGMLLRLLITLNYNITIKKPKLAKKSLPFLTIVSLSKNDTTYELKNDIERICKELELKKESEEYERKKVMKYTQRNRIALTCNLLLDILVKEGFQCTKKKSKESKETIQLMKFTELWNDHLGIFVDMESVRVLGEDMIEFVCDTFDHTAKEKIMFGKEFYYGYQIVSN